MNPKDKEGMKRVPLWLLPMVGMVQQALAHLDGAEKYGVANWREKPIKQSEMVAAMERHIKRYAAGERLDPKSGFHPLGHVMATAAILMDAEAHDTLIYDLPRSDVENAYLDSWNKFLAWRTPNDKVAPNGIGSEPKHFVGTDLAANEARAISVEDDILHQKIKPPVDELDGTDHADDGVHALRQLLFSGPQSVSETILELERTNTDQVNRATLRRVHEQLLAARTIITRS